MWSADDFIFGDPGQVRIKGMDLNNDRTTDFILWDSAHATFTVASPNITKGEQRSLELGIDAGQAGTYNPYPNPARQLQYEEAAAILEHARNEAPVRKTYFNPLEYIAISDLGTYVPTARYTPTGAQLGLFKGNDYYYMNMAESFPGLFSGIVSDNISTGKTAQSYHEKTKAEIDAEKQADIEKQNTASLETSKAATRYANEQQLALMANPTYQNYQKEAQLSLLGDTEYLRLQTNATSAQIKAQNDAQLAFMGTSEYKTLQGDLAAISAKKSNLSQIELLNDPEYKSAQNKLADYSVSASTQAQKDLMNNADYIASQKAMIDYGQSKSNAFQLSLTERNEAFQQGRGGSMTTTPTYNRYPSGRVGMKMGFAIPKGKNIFAMPALNMKPIKGKAPKMSMKMSMEIPNFNHTTKGRNMAAAFGFTHITPIAIVKMPKLPNPPHRPKSVAKMYRPKKGR